MLCSVADPFHFDTGPAPGYEKMCYGSGSRVNFETDPAIKDFVLGKSFSDEKCA